ncbi:hypothetical protein [Pseudodesulfovibrio hydrargyri]|uniref:hypothetical protein n=1 Tax=Pseudodesulfovibrio hydrargyri TaxID=2125990 RepID=UPI00101AD2F7|nr:hypothetical protein [Pseudodesulfovibrio hydrargyri]
MNRHPHLAGAVFLALVLAASLTMPSLAGTGGPSRSAVARPAASGALPRATKVGTSGFGPQKTVANAEPPDYWSSPARVKAEV